MGKNKIPVEGSNLDPINIDDDLDDNDDIGNGHEVNSVKAKLDLKGLSISVVGGDGSSKPVDIEPLMRIYMSRTLVAMKVLSMRLTLINLTTVYTVIFLTISVQAVPIVDGAVREDL